MQKILGKRIFRDFKENCVRYLALSALIVLCMYLIISLIGNADTIIEGTERAARRNRLEDGQFSVMEPLTEEEKKAVEGCGILLEEQFYFDCGMPDGSTLRVFQNRERINLMEIVEGRPAQTDREIVIERRYASEHNIAAGDKISIRERNGEDGSEEGEGSQGKGLREFSVTGIGCSPDYDAPYREFTDSSVNSGQFGTAFVTGDAYRALSAANGSGKAQELVYAYRLKGKTADKEVRESIRELSKLLRFTKAADNPRIKAAAKDQVIDKYGGILAGGIILILFAYVISVFVAYGIERENMTIGALYALGVKRRELLMHYLCLPVAVTFVSGAAGCAVGFASIGKSMVMGNCYGYFSIPQLESVYPPYLLAYGLLLPPVISALVNWLVIRKKLGRPALRMLRNEPESGRVRQVSLRKAGFVRTFRIRQMLREARTQATVLGGMFISLLLLMIGLNCYCMCRHISEDYRADTKFAYLYTCKYPGDTVPAGGYEAFSKRVKKENMGYSLDVTILGITKENPFFDLTLTESKSEVVISSAMAQKYGLKIGDVFVVKDEEEGMLYAFTVNDIARYSAGFIVFMDIGLMREMFDKNDAYYNQVFADRELDIGPEQLYSVTTGAAAGEAADVFLYQMEPMINMMICCASLVFLIVMYLMMKVMLDRCAFPISMMRVFGYRTKEIKRLYLDGTFYLIALGAAVCIPLAKKCMDLMYPMMIANVACGIDVSFPWQMYVMIYAAVLLLYFAAGVLLSGRLKRADLSEMLKNRE